MFFKVIILIFALGLFLVDNPMAKSKTYNVEILDKNPIDLCGKEFQKQVIIAPSIGQILRSDSLYGFEMSISYDPNIVQMSEKYFINTISQLFEFKNVLFDSERGEIVFDGMLSTKIDATPVAGDMPLVAFGGDFIGACDEVAEFKVKYFYPLDGFRGEVDSLNGLTIAGNIVDKPSRAIGFDFANDEQLLKKDSTITIPIDLQLGELKSLDYWKAKISIDADSIDISSIKGSSFVDVRNVTKADANSYFVEFGVDSSVGAKLFIDLHSAKADSALINLTMETVETTECACVTRFPSSSYSVSNMKTADSPTDVADDYNAEYELLNGVIVPRQGVPLNIKVYNVSGMRIDDAVCNINQVYDTKQLGFGVYFVKVTLKNKTQLIKIINN
jgi:hypothetical protein